MCEYIKDNGEQCGIDSHEGAFCHLHEDSEQAEEWRDQKREDYGAVTAGESASSETFLDPDDSGICDDCEQPVRRAVAAVTEAKFKPKRVVVEEEFTCGCGSVTVGTKEFPKTDVPDGWY